MTTTTITRPTADTPKGSRVIVEIHTGYVLSQDRPWDCRRWAPGPDGRYTSGCKCGACDGTIVTRIGTYEGTVYYADNSVEGVVKLDEPKPNGHRYHTVRYAAPSGDACY